MIENSSSLNQSYPAASASINLAKKATTTTGIGDLFTKQYHEYQLIVADHRICLLMIPKHCYSYLHCSSLILASNAPEL